ncbi:MAG TPA: type VI secretion system tube protein Hcp, partial [Thermoanaerobaculia bacterium]
MAINSYIKLDGIDGGSSASGHEKEIEIMSWSHGFSQPTSPVR